MDSYKIDILLLSDIIVSQNLSTENQQYFTISNLNEIKSIYEDFIQLVESKTTISYTQIYVSKEPIIRFVVLNVNETSLESFEETDYSQLTDNEKEIFDQFYGSFKS